MNPWTTGYPIGKAQRLCTHTGQTLHVGDPIVAALIEDPDKNLLHRRDYSLPGWTQARAADLIPDSTLLGFWKSHLHPPNEKPKPILDDEAMLDLFNQTQSHSDAGPRANLRLVLALMLIRRRLLTHDANRGTTMLVRTRGTPRPPQGPPLLEVHDPGISESTIAEVIAELESLGLTNPDQSTQPTTTTTTTGADQ
jgi:hypothetical protein